LTLEGVTPNDQYTATLDLESGTTSRVVHEYGNGLPTFFADLAASWRGWDGTKSYHSLEGELALSAVHDGLGTVELMVTIGQPWPPEWSTTASVDLGAGAHLQNLASLVADWVGSS
jgi:hypothetical protein